MVVTAGFALLPIAPASAGAAVPNFSCDNNSVYTVEGSSPHTITKINSVSGASSANGKFAQSKNDDVNALALPAGGGRYIYGFDRADNTILKFDATNQAVAVYSAPTNNSAGSVVAGAINPATGIYYYASGGSSWAVNAFDTNTNTALGKVATISGTGLSGNGDFAFDALGNLFIVSNANTTAAGTLARVNQALPTTAGNTALTITVLTTTPANSGQYHSMAFDSSGALVIGSGGSPTKLTRVDPSDGTSLTNTSFSGAFADMASCSLPSSASANVNLPSGRYTNSDQFGVKITGNGVTTGNSGTTEGVDTGLQNTSDEVAGPVVVLPSKTYTITQTAAGGTNLGNYTTTWKCVDGSNATVSSGTGQTGTFTMPGTSGANVICTFTNIPKFPAIELEKTASAINDLDGNGPDVGDTITYDFKVTNTGQVVLNPVTVSDPKLGAITCPNTALAVGASLTCTSKTYTLTQADVDAGKVDNTATASGTSPTGVVVKDPDTVSTSVTGKSGIELTKTASAINDLDSNGPDAGDTITYNFKVKNTGNVTLNPVTVNDPLFAGASPNVTCPAGALAPGATVTCSAKTYTLTQADVNNGKVDNTATATGTTPGGTKVTDDDDTTTPVVVSKTNIRVTKTVNDATPHAGDVVTYTLKVTNDGPASATDVVLKDVLPSGVTFVSADAPCTQVGSTVTCAFGTLAAGATRTVTIKAKVNALAPAGSGDQHLIDVQKTEAQLDVDPGQQRTLSVSCAPGYIATDGSGRIDHVDQGTGTLGSLRVLESRAVGLDGWQVTVVNQATGRAQAKVFAVCVKAQTESVNGHTHQLQVSGVVTTTRSITGATTETLTCAPGQQPIQPGYVLNGTANVPTSYPAGTDGWTFVVAPGTDGSATSATFSIRCLDRSLSVVNGHTHQLNLNEIRQTVTVQPGQVAEFTLSCADDAKGIVAGYDMDPGLVNLGNDPRPKIRVFKFFNPTAQPLNADLWLLCMGTRTTGADANPRVVNTASVTTATDETTTSDNSDSAEFNVDSSTVTPGSVFIAGSTVSLSNGKVRAAVTCAAGTKTCKGTAVMIASKTQRINGKLVRKGTVLAKVSYKIAASRKATLVLRPTAVGRTALRSTSLKTAKLRVGATTKVVRIKR